MSSDEDDSRREEENGDPDEAEVIGDTDDDTLRIMVCTDNHLGYCESDPIRGLDSFAAFEEILFLAKHFKCDMVLIAGDLFHDNKPSRRTLHKTMDIIRRYTMGPDPVKIQILSDQAKNFRSNKKVNYEDEFYSVDLPIFSIHGNHDDPTRVDGGTEMLAALDLLAVSNLVNYFGRQDEVERVEVSPVLLQKGTTRVALYGMGSMRDERLHRMWVGKKVRFLRPADQEADDEVQDEDDDDNNKWFNIFALHQNRDLGRGSKNCVHESMIPEWMDLVVWGHEHECRIEPGESVIGTFRISQPGSSVATSLISGEAVRKQVGILDIRNNQFRLKPIPLTQVRSFAMSEVSLRELKDHLDAEDPKIDAKVTKVLENEVKLVIQEARQKTKDLLADAKSMGNVTDDGKLKYALEKRDAVLVRVKVDHSGFTTLNNQRFGAKFVGLVANASDILLFHRRKQDAKPDETKAGAKKRGAAALARPIAPGELENEIRVEDLVKENLDMAEKKLEILSENRLTVALDEFVTKEQNKSIEDAMEVMLGIQQKKLFSGSAGEKDSGTTADEDARDVSMSKSRDEDVEEVSQMSEKDDDVSPPIGAKKKRAAAPKAAPAKRGAAARGASSRKKPTKVADSDDDDIVVDDDDDDFDLPAPKQSKRAPAKAAARPKRVTKVAQKKYKVDSDDEQEESFQDDVVDEDSELSDLDVRPKKQTRTAASAKKAKSTQLSFETKRRPRTTASKPKQGTKRRVDDDDDSKDDRYGNSYDVDDDWGKANTETQS